MPNVCGRYRRPMSSHDDHASRLEAWIISRPALLATVQGLHQKSPLWSVEMISVIGCWSVGQVR